ncbi:hypothetical protein NKH69_20815 [Mesorhizobium sp. M0976]|uniref:hypothetical protein n=1 Tax=Mesorhizobium sp. M0976 TaxID=2957038 RepID=UPI00333C5FD8
MEKGVCGVVNFPPAALVETSSEAGSEEHLNAAELERMRWFAENGFALVLTSTTRDVAAGKLLQKKLDAILHVPALGLSCPIASVIPLVRLDEMGSELDVWSLPAPLSPQD